MSDDCGWATSARGARLPAQLPRAFRYPCKGRAPPAPSAGMRAATTLGGRGCCKGTGSGGGTFTRWPGVQNAATFRTASCPIPIATDGTDPYPRPQVADTMLHCGYGPLVRGRRDGAPADPRRQFVQASVMPQVDPVPNPLVLYRPTSGPLAVGDTVVNAGTAGHAFNLAVTAGTVTLSTIATVPAFDLDGASSLASASPTALRRGTMTLAVAFHTPTTLESGTIMAGQAPNQVRLVQAGSTISFGVGSHTTPPQQLRANTTYVALGTVSAGGWAALSLNGAVGTGVRITSTAQLSQVWIGADAAATDPWIGLVGEVRVFEGLLANEAGLLDDMAARYGVALVN